MFGIICIKYNILDIKQGLVQSGKIKTPTPSVPRRGHDYYIVSLSFVQYERGKDYVKSERDSNHSNPG